MFRDLRLLIGAGLAAILTLGNGCSSTDRHVFESTELLPTSIEVVDVIDNRVVWEMDIPANHQLVLEFHRHGERGRYVDPKRPATGMNWTLYEITRPGTDNTRRQERQVERDYRPLEGRPIQMRVDYGEPAPGTDQRLDDYDPADLPSPQELDQQLEQNTD